MLLYLTQASVTSSPNLWDHIDATYICVATYRSLSAKGMVRPGICRTGLRISVAAMPVVIMCSMSDRKYVVLVAGARGLSPPDNFLSGNYYGPVVMNDG
jgi:hypothetical protein